MIPTKSVFDDFVSEGAGALRLDICSTIGGCHDLKVNTFELIGRPIVNYSWQLVETFNRILNLYQAPINKRDPNINTLLMPSDLERFLAHLSPQIGR